MEREKFSSRLGFILISAGCAIGLGNVWRFPYIVGEYGGAAFILIYLLFLVIFGLPIMTMEFSVGRASGKSIAKSFEELEPKGTKWHHFGYVGVVGNYLLMMFYTSVTGWMFAYLFKSIRGDFVGAAADQISAQFASLNANPIAMSGFMILTVVVGFLICSLGLKKGVEKITKVMMLALLAIIVVLAVHAVTLDGASEGLKYYLIPDFSRITEHSLGEVIFAALGQSFFTLSIGIGSMAIFGSYIKKDRKLFGEAVSIALLDTFVAFTAGLIIIPSCFAYNVNPGAGPGLIFETLPVVFANMAGGRIWGTLFFLFLLFAALSTIIAVFENIVAFAMELWGWSRKKACILNIFIVIALSLPAALGFNVLSFVQPLGAGSTILDLEDFIVSNNLLPLGSLIYVLFCCSEKYGWGFKNFLNEANTGKGIGFSPKMHFYTKYILPAILIIVLAQGYISKFCPNLFMDIINLFK
ncbi:MAG: sodium-dependent transporter [Clostridia bacterium]|nr:sodium-dependent transporter [Clostridia bacterium]